MLCVNRMLSAVSVVVLVSRPDCLTAQGTLRWMGTAEFGGRKATVYCGVELKESIGFVSRVLLCLLLLLLE